MNGLAIKWEMTGLLEGLTIPQKEQCAEHLETLTTFLVERSKIPNKKFFDESYATMIIPIVRRLYDTKFQNNMPDMEWLCYDFAEFVKRCSLKREECYTGLDYEMELCAEYTTDLVKRKI
jgi:hypothetical protein